MVNTFSFKCYYNMFLFILIRCMFNNVFIVCNMHYSRMCQCIKFNLLRGACKAVEYNFLTEMKL